MSESGENEARVPGAESGTRVALVNGESALQVSLFDRALQYGDGLFRTVLVDQGAALNLNRHLKHIQHGCQVLGIDSPHGFRETIARETEELCEQRKTAILKIVVTRGQGGRGYAPTVTSGPTRILAVSAAPSHPPGLWEKGVKIRLCRTPAAENTALAGIKHLNRLPQVLARGEWKDPEIFQGLMSDSGGNLVGGTMSNILAVQRGCIYTPALDAAGVAGTQREQVLETAEKAGYGISRGHWPPEFYACAEEVFLTNAVLGILPVQSIEDEPVAHAPGPVTRHLMGLVPHPRHNIIGLAP